MKLNRLYSNQPRGFSPIEFNDGLSVVLAEIRVPANRSLDTHNLGKTTVGELIDFCLLKGKSPASFFLSTRDASLTSPSTLRSLWMTEAISLLVARSSLVRRSMWCAPLNDRGRDPADN